MSYRAIAITVALVAASMQAIAAEPAKTPTAAPARTVAVKTAPATAAPAKVATAASGAKVTVVSVSGVAEKIVAGKKSPLKAGDQLDELTVIRTGLRTKVVLKLGDRGEIIINRATKMGIAEFRKQNKLTRTRLGLKYGSMRATIDSSKGPNDAQIATPVATLSVRGSEADIGYTGDRGLGLRGRSGQWRVAAGNRTRTIAAGEQTDSQLSLSILMIVQQQTTYLGDTTGGLTSNEINALTQNRPSRSAFNAGGSTSTQSDVGPTFEQKPPDDSPNGHIIVGI